LVLRLALELAEEVLLLPLAEVPLHLQGIL
jgi:hypothetical protein